MSIPKNIWFLLSLFSLILVAIAFDLFETKPSQSQEIPGCPPDVSRQENMDSKSGKSVEEGVSSTILIEQGCFAEKKWFPWQVGLVNPERRIPLRGNIWCGGVILSEHWVVTAAHCVYGVDWRSISVYAGPVLLPEQNANRYKYPLAHTPIFTKQYLDQFKNPPCMSKGKKDPACLDFDIALLKLKDPLPLNDSTIRPVQIETNNADQKKNADDPVWIGSPVWMAGWGGSNAGNLPSVRLLYSRLATQSAAACEKKIGHDVTDNMFCSAETQKTSCSGDSGGGAVVRNEAAGKFLLAGLISWGGTKCDGTIPTVFTRVSKFQAWIDRFVGASVRPSNSR